MAFARRLLTAKPKPCPLDLVVNRGVKILLLMSSGMPSPESSTVMMHVSFSLVAVMVIFPPLGMACSAFVIRFVSMRFR